VAKRFTTQATSQRNAQHQSMQRLSTQRLTTCRIGSRRPSPLLAATAIALLLCTAAAAACGKTESAPRTPVNGDQYVAPTISPTPDPASIYGSQETSEIRGVSPIYITGRGTNLLLSVNVRTAQNKQAQSFTFQAKGGTIAPVSAPAIYNTALIKVPLGQAPEGVHIGQVFANFGPDDTSQPVYFSLQVGLSTAPAIPAPMTSAPVNSAPQARPREAQQDDTRPQALQGTD